MAAVEPLLGPCVRCFPDSPPGLWIVENVGTRPEMRRRGMVAALLERALQRGRERGFSKAQISCLIGNDTAQRAYERVGFRVVEERRDADFEALLGAPGYSRMTLALKE
jgi:translation initiation factor 4G